MGPHFHRHEGAKSTMHFGIERGSDSHVLKSEQSVAVLGDTIAAISTPVGEGAIALVRISGTGAVKVADAIFHGTESPPQLRSHAQQFGEIRENGEFGDPVSGSVH